MKNGAEAFRKVISWAPRTILDIGCGDGTHARGFSERGIEVTTVDFQHADYVGNYLNFPLRGFDCLWACHVLEHQPDVGRFLRKCFADLDDGGILAVTVPPAKPEIVGGHLTLWNAGLLLYNLILAGFDCSQAAIKTYGYNISVVVRKVPAKLPVLKMDFGDIETLAEFFPLAVHNGFDGRIEELNW